MLRGVVAGVVQDAQALDGQQALQALAVEVALEPRHQAPPHLVGGLLAEHGAQGGARLRAFAAHPGKAAVGGLRLRVAGQAARGQRICGARAGQVP